MSIDKTDYKILWNLDYHARMPLSGLAHKVNLSKQSLNYRLKKLIRDNVLLGFRSMIDIHRLGYLTYRIYFRFKNVDSRKEEEIIAYLKSNNHVLWLASISGSWDVEAVFTARNTIHLNNLFKKIKEDFGQHFSKYNISSSIINYHFQRDYLLAKKREEFIPRYYGFEPKPQELDQLDVGILVQLSENCRQNHQEIARKLGVTYHTIKHRIEAMEQKSIIQSHRAFMNLSAINRIFYKALIKLNNPTKRDEQKLYSYCQQWNVVVYLVEVLGEWQLEIETEVENQEEFTELLRQLRNNFSDMILDYETLQVTKEHKLNYFPMGQEIMLK
ncbi:AsnC family transcriptional regulator [Candidatus Woesearchaeota archaeon]|nr:AsnC family transcriptional regulator [Candidatus Woesearchaeota archaeon]